MDYEHRFVVFIDILGFREIINSTVAKNKSNNETITKLNKIVTSYSSFFSDEEIKDDLFTSKRVTQFSDTVVISFVLNNPGDIIFTLNDCLHLIMNLLWDGFLCRGAITFGKLIHTDKAIFGPALIEAYDLESKAALYPRVIISEAVLKSAVKEYKKRKQLDEDDLFYGLEQIYDALSKDLDGFYFIDYIRKVQAEIDEDNFEEYYKRLRLLIEKGMKSSTKHVMIKYSWMKEKYNQFVKKAKSKESLNNLKKHQEYDLLDFCKKLQLI